MSTLTSFDRHQGDSAKLSELEQRLESSMRKAADFVALYEAAVSKMQARDEAIEDSMLAHQRAVDKQLKNFRHVLSEFEDVMTQAGAARWRVEARDALKTGREHLDAMEKATQQFKTYVDDSQKTMDQCARDASLKIKEAVQRFRPEDFKKITQQNTEQVDKATLDAMRRISTVVRWFQWEKFGMTIVVAIGVSLLTALFVNDESPIESHARVKSERSAGRVLMQAWPQLSADERRHIKQLTSALPN